MAKKLVTLLLMCIVVAATLQTCAADPNHAQSPEARKKFAREYDACMKPCMKKCDRDGKQYTDCEMKCDENCSEKEDNDKVRTYAAESKKEEKEKEKEKDPKEKQGRKRK